jgi:hypothetical protein
VLWVLVDGLRLDASRAMPELAKLRAAGADYAAEAAFPSYSLPNYVAQASGLAPAYSGIRTNHYGHTVPIDSVFRAAKREGLTTAAAGTDGDWFTELFPGCFDRVILAREPTRPEADLAIVHLDYPDASAHARGSRSADYAAAVTHADRVIAALVRDLDLRRDAVVVTADHGHIDRGGHGGNEPEALQIPIVLVGAGVMHAPTSPTSGVAQAEDVGPTIAALLGVPPLGDARGRVLPAVATPPRYGAARARVLAAVAALQRGAPARLRRARLYAAPFALGTLAVLWAAARGVGARACLSAPVGAIVLIALYGGTDSISFSSANHEPSFALRFGLLASVAAVAQLWVGGRRSAGPAALVAGLAAAVALWVAPEWSPIDLPSPQASFAYVLMFGGLAVMAGWAAVWGRFGPPSE